jgi:hypothetical protein
VKAFQRPTNALPTVMQTGVPTPFQRHSNGIPTDCPLTPHTPQALGAPFWGLREAPGRPSAAVVRKGRNASLCRRTVRRGGAV